MDLEERSKDKVMENSKSRYLKYLLIPVGIYCISLATYELIYSVNRTIDSVSNYLN